jgi:pyruvate ferredoxin oxidoreductase delta subunit
MADLKKSSELEEGGLIPTPKTSKNFKTGGWRTFRPKIDEGKCIHCSLCVLDCPENCIEYTKDKRGDINFDYCKGCGICSNICPVQAITMENENK